MHLYISTSAPGIQSTATFTPVKKDQGTLYGKPSQKSGKLPQKCFYRERVVIYNKGTALWKNSLISHFFIFYSTIICIRQINQNKHPF